MTAKLALQFDPSPHLPIENVIIARKLDFSFSNHRTQLLNLYDQHLPKLFVHMFRNQMRNIFQN